MILWGCDVNLKSCIDNCVKFILGCYGLVSHIFIFQYLFWGLWSLIHHWEHKQGCPTCSPGAAWSPGRLWMRPNTKSYIYLKHYEIFLWSHVAMYLMCGPKQQLIFLCWPRDAKRLDTPASSWNKGPGNFVLNFHVLSLKDGCVSKYRPLATCFPNRVLKYMHSWVLIQNYWIIVYWC